MKFEIALHVALLAFFFCVAAGSTVSNPPDLSRLQQILDQQAEQYNTTLSLGLFHKNFGAFGVASGCNVMLFSSFFFSFSRVIV